MIKTLPDAPLDIIGDVHGEFAALKSLLRHLGYAEDGFHPRGRRVVFVGDLCDRGPDSPSVLALVQRWVETGHAYAVLGNHELNLLRGERKDGNDWFFNEGVASEERYRPWAVIAPSRRDHVLDFFSRLPVALERSDLRIVHAAWDDDAVTMLRTAPHQLGVTGNFEALDLLADEVLYAEGWLDRERQEHRRWGARLRDPYQAVPFLPAHAQVAERRQMDNPIRVLTSGVERMTAAPFFAGGQWRFVARQRWWEHYDSQVPVVVGHYWRRWRDLDRAALGKRDEDIFRGVTPLDWLGPRGRVFCVDFSVGARFLERRKGQALGSSSQLMALQWPERVLVSETGQEYVTRCFGERDSVRQEFAA